MLLNDKLKAISSPTQFGSVAGVNSGDCELIFTAIAVDKTTYNQLIINGNYEYNHHGSILSAKIDEKIEEDLSIKFRCNSKTF